MKIKLKGLNHRGKSRVGTFGPWFELKDAPKFHNRPDHLTDDDILVEDLNGNWIGWLTVGKEVEVIENG